MTNIRIRRVMTQWKWHIFIPLLWLLFIVMTFLVYISHPNGAGDFSYYFRGASRLADGLPLYDDLTSRSYVGPALWVQMLLPIIRMSDFDGAARIWFAINVGLLLATLVLLNRYIQSQRIRRFVYLMPIVFMPTFMTLLLGQATIVLFALTVAGWALYREGKYGWVGLPLALATWVKFYPGLLIIYFLWKRQWTVVMSAVIWGMLLLLVQVIGIGLDNSVHYFTQVLPPLLADGQPQLAHSNHAVVGVAQRLFSDVPQIIPLVESPVLYTVTRYGLMLILLGGMLYIISRPLHLSKTPTSQFDLEYSLVLLVALLTGSTLGTHGILSTVLVLAVILDTSRRGTRRFWLVMALAISIFLINLHPMLILGYLQPPSDNHLSGVLLSSGFLGMMILVGVTLWALSYLRAQPSSPQA